jgi:PAS domain S-box-containing protein
MGNVADRSMLPNAPPRLTAVAPDTLEAAFDVAPVGMAIGDADGAIVRANASLSALLGYAPEELVGTSITDLTHPDDVAASIGAFHRIACREVSDYSLEKRYVHKDGHVIWARAYVSTLQIEPRRYLLHVTDITAERQFDERLRATETRFREMAEAIEHDFWIISADPFHLLYASPAAERIWGFDTMTNRDRPGRIRKLVHADDAAAFVALFDPSRPDARELEYRAVRADDGAPRWFRTRVFPVRNAAGVIDRLTGVTEDITPRKEAEIAVKGHQAFDRFIMNLSTELVNPPAQRAHEIFEYALGELGAMIGADRGAIFVIDEKTDILSNRYGWSAESVDLDSSITQFWFGPGNPFRDHLLREGLLRIDDVRALPDELADVRDKILANNVLSFIDVPLARRGRLIGLVAFATVGRKVTWPADVAARLSIAAEVFANAIERGQMEAEVRKHRDALAHALRVGTMGQLASGIAHELNQPLAAILNYASACERRVAGGTTDPAFIRDTVRKMGDQAMRAADVIKTLRMLVRKGEGERTWQDPHELVQRAITFLEPELIEPGIAIVVQRDAGLPNVQVDPIQIEQVVLNLVRNAVDAVRTSEKGSRPEVRVALRLRSPSTVEVSVTDNGPGVSPEETGRIFDEFYTTKAHGLGLGLSISRSIVESHGGSLWLQSTDPPGTTFCFTLPTSPQ